MTELILATHHNSGVSTEERLESPAENPSVSKANRSTLYPARAGNARSADSLNRDPRTLINYACDKLIEQLMTLEGRFTSCPRRFRKYLKTLSLEQLAARRARVFKEQCPALENGTPEHETGKPDSIRRDPHCGPHIATPPARGSFQSHLL